MPIALHLFLTRRAEEESTKAQIFYVSVTAEEGPDTLRVLTGRLQAAYRASGMFPLIFVHGILA